MTAHEIKRDTSFLEEFVALFPAEQSDDTTDDDDILEEVSLTLIIDLYTMITDHFNRIHFAELLDSFKETIPKKKKQALRPSLQSKTKTDTKKRGVECQPQTGSADKQPKASTSKELSGNYYSLLMNKMSVNCLACL